MELTWFGKLCCTLYMVNVYKDGDTYGFTWRWWNPLSWVAALGCFVLMVLVQGWPETMKYKHEIGFGLSPYFKENPEELVWF